MTTTLENPTISLCTPTFNRRPFIKMMIECFEHQTYPKDKIEWIIMDDGTDKIGDLVTHIPQVKYFSYDEKMSLGKKRNLIHTKTTGEIIIYMDDDDYYPPERISHAVEMLIKNPEYEIAGSSNVYTCFIDLGDIYQFKSCGDNQVGAATFAFRRSYLEKSQYYDSKEFGEEFDFLNKFQVKILQLDSLKTILVLNHDHNTCDKYKFINGEFNDDTTVKKINNGKISDFIKNKKVFDIVTTNLFEDVQKYDLGELKYKPYVMGEQNKHTLSKLSLSYNWCSKNILYLKNETDNLKKIINVQEKKYNERITQLELTINELKQKI
jgi:glycosyltransferase involved in cell wall biosynthesis